MFFKISIASILALMPYVSCFSTGAGTCTASVATVGMMAGSTNALTGFSLTSASTSYVPGGASVSVTITSTTAAASFTGFLMYATTGAGTKVGSWTPDTAATPNWQIGSINACTTDTTVITHTNANAKTAGTATYKWIPPATGQGPVTFNIAIMDVNRQFQVNNAALALTGPTAAPATAAPATATALSTVPPTAPAGINTLSPSAALVCSGACAYRFPTTISTSLNAACIYGCGHIPTQNVGECAPCNAYPNPPGNAVNGTDNLKNPYTVVKACLQGCFFGVQGSTAAGLQNADNNPNPQQAKGNDASNSRTVNVFQSMAVVIVTFAIMRAVKFMQ